MFMVFNNEKVGLVASMKDIMRKIGNFPLE